MNNDLFVRALGWALAHSLWQGALIALALLILLPRLRSARQRYRAAYGSLLLLLASGISTLVWHYSPEETTLAAAADDLSQPAAPVLENTWALPAMSLPSSISQQFVTWLDAHHNLVVGAWLTGFVFFLLRLGGGMWQIRRLQTRGIQQPEPFWLEKFNHLCRRMGYTRSVRLLESALVRTPMAMGWLKPVVLLPVGMVNQLSVAEVEAVLAHELAHIARRDWLFNLLQAFIESLFYFHPAVWWVSAVVRRERENCCDDAALAATGNPLAFAKALVQVQEMAVPVPALALGLSGKRRRPLLERVRRILNQPQQQQHQAMEKVTATVILLALLAFVGLRANSVPVIESAFSQISAFPSYWFGDEDPDQMAQDTVPKPKNTRKITREDGDEKVEAEYRDGKLTRLNINGEEIPEAEFEQHEGLLDELEAIDAPTPPLPPGTFDFHFDFPAPPVPMEGFNFKYAMPALPPMPPMPPGNPVRIFSDKDGEGNTVIVLENEGEPTEIVVKKDDVYINGKKLEKGESINIPGFHLAPNGEGFYFENKEGSSIVFDEAHAQEYARAMELHHREMERAMRESQVAMERDMKRNEEAFKQSQKAWAKEQKEWEKEQKKWEKEQQKWEKEQQKWEKEQQKWEKEQRAWEVKHKAMEQAVKSELLKDGLISDASQFSLKLNDKEMFVNNKQVSAELHRKYLALVEKATGDKLKGSFMFNFSD